MCSYDFVSLSGIGDMILIKSIVQSTGRSMTSIKNDLDKSGDLGIVAEESRGSQQIMFKPQPLTLRAVFKKLREIADLKGACLLSLFFTFYPSSTPSSPLFVLRSLQHEQQGEQDPVHAGGVPRGRGQVRHPVPLGQAAHRAGRAVRPAGAMSSQLN